MIPDLDFFLEDRIFSNESWTDAFLFHASFDRALPESDLFFAAQMLLLFVVINLFAIVASVGTLKRVREVIFGKKVEEEDEDSEGEEEHNGEEGVGEGNEVHKSENKIESIEEYGDEEKNVEKGVEGEEKGKL
jgi:hypothetical protein